MIWFAVVHAAAPVQLDLPTAIDAAWQAAAERRVLQARIAREDHDAYLRLDDPQFRMGFDNVGSELDALQVQYRVRVPLEDLPAAFAEARARRAASGVEQAELAVLEDAVRLETVARFDRVRLLEAELGLLDEELVATERRVEVVQKRVEAGLAVEEDVVDVAFDRAQVERKRIETSMDLTVARAELLGWTGQPADAALTLQGPDLRETLQASFDERSEHLESRIASASLREAELERKAAAIARVPFVDWVQADVQTEAGKVPTFGLGFAVNVPVFHWLDRTVAAAKQGMAMHQAELDALQAEHAAEMARDRVQLASARTALAALDEAIQRAATVLETHRAKLTPDEALAYDAQLFDERRQTLDLLEQGLEARRRLEASVRMSP